MCVLCYGKLLPSCPTLCESVDCNPPGSSVHGILQARILGGLPRSPPGDMNEANSGPSSLLDVADYGLQRAE